MNNILTNYYYSKLVQIEHLSYSERIESNKVVRQRAMYSIKAISIQTGVQPETIRTWERRYKLLEPVRDGSGRRVYTEDDAAKLRLIASLVKAGHAIRHLVELDDEALKAMGAQPTRTVRKPEEQQLVDDLCQAIKNADIIRFRLLIGYALSLHEPVSAVEHVLIPTWRMIGEFWQDEEITVGLEHTLTAIMKQELFSVIRTWQMAAKGPKLVFAALGGELHEIGLLLGCFLGATEGYDCHYWGPNLPADYLVEAVDQFEPKAVILSVIRCPDPARLKNELAIAAQKLPAKVDLCIGTRPDIVQLLNPLPSRAVLFESFEPFHDYLIALKK